VEVTRPTDRVLSELLFLQELAQSAASTQDADELLRLIIDKTTGAMGTNVSSLYLLMPDGDLVLWATNGLDRSAIGKLKLKIGQGITGWVAENRVPLAVEDTSKDPRFFWVQGVDHERFHSMLSVPILAGPRLVGVLNVQSEERRKFSQEEIDFLSAIAAQVAGIIERSELHRQLAAKLSEIQFSSDVHERFTKLAVSGAGLKTILKEISRFSQTPVGLYDLGGFLTDSATSKDHELPEKLPLNANSLRRISASDRETLVHTQEVGSLLLLPLKSGTVSLGIMAAAIDTLGKPLDALTTRVLQHGATVLTLELAKERAGAEAERRLRGELMEDLLNPSLDEPTAKRLALQASHLGYTIRPESWVVAIEPDPGSIWPEINTKLADSLANLIADSIHESYNSALIAPRLAYALAVIPHDPTKGKNEMLSNLITLGHKIIKSCRSRFPALSLSVGISDKTQAISELARAAEEARQAARLIQRAGKKGQVVSYKELGIFRLILTLATPEQLTNFVEETLGFSVTKENKKSAVTVKTLQTLVDHNWSLSKAANALGVHINTIRYRIEKLKAETGMDIDNPSTRITIAVALWAKTYLTKET